MTQEDVLRKVQALLKLGESDNPNESAAAIAMAQRLMDEHAISEAMLSAEGGQSDEPDEEVQDWADPIGKAGASWRGQLSMALATPNGCLSYRRGKGLHIIGRASGASQVRYLFSYCEREIDRLAARNGGNGRTWLNNFRHGCVDAIRDAIQREQRALRDKLRADAAGTMALVPLQNAIARVDGYKREAELFGRVNLRLRSGGQSSYRGDQGARQSGRQAGAGIYPGGDSRQVGAGRRAIRG